ncbi:MAG TPA: hypothetical protein DD727_04675 [Clostridiales bacterium]|nr:hypothetical protein [Clostridiales bacterium]
MQNTTELIIKAMNYQYPEEIPVYIGFLPAAMKVNGDAIREIIKEYPAFFGDYWLKYDYERNLPISYHYGSFTDAWGCVWSNEQEGMESYVTGHPLTKREDILKLKVPEVDAGLPHGFMYLRLLDLRGFEEAMLDFAEECDEIQILIDKVCEYNVRQMRLLCEKNQSPVIHVGDDLGMQNGLAIGAVKWRKYLKPAFKRIYDVSHEYNRYVYMHTDGDIIEIMPDLVETGVNMINPQYRANGIERLVRTCKGQIPVMLDLDRQLFPFGTPKDMRDHVRETIEKMYLPEGGLGINIEIGMDVPLQNIESIIDEMDRMRLYRGEKI